MSVRARACDIVGVVGGHRELHWFPPEHLPDVLWSMFVYVGLRRPWPSISVVDGSDSEEKPLKGGSSRSLHGDDTAGDSVSRDSLVEYADGGGEFSEDGSFIGEYSGRKHAGSVSDASAVTA